jgi:inosose dehydratase
VGRSAGQATGVRLSTLSVTNDLVNFRESTMSALDFSPTDTPVSLRIAGAPISWGVCEVPGWGPMLPAERVLREMCSLGLTATELGAPGFLPSTADGVKAVLGEAGMELLGGFVPLVVHDSARRDDCRRQVIETAAFLAEAGGSMFISALVIDAGWSPRRTLSASEWNHLMAMLGEIDRITADHGLTQVVHPHVGTVVETAAEIQRVVDGCSTKWCLDTGHMTIGGCHPADFARRYGESVGHVHLKDVRMPLAERMNAGELTLMQATIEGMFCPLGEGDVLVAETMVAMAERGYDGWFVIEQDISLTDFPPEGAGPIDDVATSVRFARAAV